MAREKKGKKKSSSEEKNNESDSYSTPSGNDGSSFKDDSSYQEEMEDIHHKDENKPKTESKGRGYSLKKKTVTSKKNEFDETYMKEMFMKFMKAHESMQRNKKRSSDVSISNDSSDSSKKMKSRSPNVSDLNVSVKDSKNPVPKRGNLKDDRNYPDPPHRYLGGSSDPSDKNRSYQLERNSDVSDTHELAYRDTEPFIRTNRVINTNNLSQNDTHLSNQMLNRSNRLSSRQSYKNPRDIYGDSLVWSTQHFENVDCIQFNNHLLYFRMKHILLDKYNTNVNAHYRE